MFLLPITIFFKPGLNLSFGLDVYKRQDIQNGLRAFRLDRLVEGLKDPSKLSQADLAKLQRVLENNEMPIAKFRHLHWGSKPDEQEEVALLNWIREARKMSLPKETPNVDADRRCV